jgi:putative SOS response-associated peptidase YedK
MCGRFSLTLADLAALAREWSADLDRLLAEQWKPRFNVAPGQPHPLLREVDGRRVIVPATFGLAGPRGMLLPNARSETAAERRSFAVPLRQARCAVPVDGFYEWEGPPSARRPSWFHLEDGRVLLLAAVAAPSPDGTLGFSILTTGAIEPVVRLHDRMPVVLPPGLVGPWLAAGPPPPIPAPVPGQLAARPLSPRVNSITHDDPACLEPLEPEGQLKLL